MPQDDGFDGETRQGNSYRQLLLDFDEIDSRLTLCRIPLLRKNFMSMSDYLDAKPMHHLNAGHEKKERYTRSPITRTSREQGMSAYFSYSHAVPSGQPGSGNYNLSLSRYFDLGSIKKSQCVAERLSQRI